jgi:8-oxo-dGTP pyrophosphatase MutT (NUDIX family)
VNADEQLGTFRDVPWAPQPNVVYVVASTVEPPDELVTAVEVLAFADGRLLMTEVRTRGWDLPGGHRDASETSVEAARRECVEEAGAVLGPLSSAGHYRIELLGEMPPDHRYPWPTSYIGILTGQVLSMTGEATETDCLRGELCSDDAVEARAGSYPWFPLYRRQATRRA